MANNLAVDDDEKIRGLLHVMLGRKGTPCDDGKRRSKRH